jgi:tripartite-type tricarboxylate transporter receptor subunit TctC
MPNVWDASNDEIQAMFSTVPSVLGATRSGKVRVLGVTSLTRAPDLPDAPTIAESGMPGFEVVSWQGLCTPPGVPQDAIVRLRAALDAALALPETGRRLGEQGFQLNALDSTKFAAFIGAERSKWSKLVKDLRIEPK